MSLENTDPDWASKITPEQFFNEARRRRALGMRDATTDHNREVLDRLEPGWYSAWEDADPMSDEAFYRRNAIVEGVVPDVIQAINNEEAPTMTLLNELTQAEVEILLVGTDEEMRATVRDALKVLLPEG